MPSWIDEIFNELILFLEADDRKIRRVLVWPISENIKKEKKTLELKRQFVGFHLVTFVLRISFRTPEVAKRKVFFPLIYEKKSFSLLGRFFVLLFFNRGSFSFVLRECGVLCVSKCSVIQLPLKQVSECSFSEKLEIRSENRFGVSANRYIFYWIFWLILCDYQEKFQDSK